MSAGPAINKWHACPDSDSDQEEDEEDKERDGHGRMATRTAN